MPLIKGKFWILIKRFADFFVIRFDVNSLPKTSMKYSLFLIALADTQL